MLIILMPYFNNIAYFCPSLPENLCINSVARLKRRSKK